MLTITQTWTFLLTAVVLTATPGPDNLMVLSMGMSKGRRAGMAFGLGCALGCVSHTVLAVIGVSALVAASPWAFTLLKWAGGGYLVWLGIQALRYAGTSSVRTAVEEGGSVSQAFAKGLLANAINPKVVLFFLSFLPQFVDASRGDAPWQLGALGLLFAAQAAVMFGVLGYFSGTVGTWLTRKPAASRWLDRVAGAVFVALGLKMIASR